MFRIPDSVEKLSKFREIMKGSFRCACSTIGAPFIDWQPEKPHPQELLLLQKTEATQNEQKFDFYGLEGATELSSTQAENREEVPAPYTSGMHDWAEGRGREEEQHTCILYS